jgi:transposase
MGRRSAFASSCDLPTAKVFGRSLVNWTWHDKPYGFGSCGSIKKDSLDSTTFPVLAVRSFFPPAVATHLVKIACELPDKLGRSLSHWDCVELARKLVDDGLVESISPDTVRRMLAYHKVKPWLKHLWLTPKAPRDAMFCQIVHEICDLYTRPLGSHEAVLCVDEKTSLQPRTRLAPTLPARPGEPVRVEHEYERKGALNLFAAFDTRSGKVHGQCHERKRQVEFIAFLEHLDQQVPAHVTLIHLVMDNLRVHKGKQVQAWLAQHPRFQFHFTPVHCSWMNQVEQWFGILQRKRFAIADFESKADLKEKTLEFISHWNRYAKPFKWTRRSFDKVLAKAEAQTLAAAA